MNRQMPHSIDIEQAILGALIMYASSVREAIDYGLSPQDFYEERHARIYECILEIANEGKAVDIHIVTSRLKDKNRLIFIGGPEYLFQ